MRWFEKHSKEKSNIIHYCPACSERMELDSNVLYCPFCGYREDN